MRQILIPNPGSHSAETFNHLSRRAVGEQGLIEPGLHKTFGAAKFAVASYEIRVVSRKKGDAISQLIRDNTREGWEAANIWHLLQTAVPLRGKKLPLVAFPSNIEKEPEKFPVLSEKGYRRQLVSWDRSTLLDHPEAYFLFVRKTY